MKKRWTSILGNFEIRFQVYDIDKFWKQFREYKESNKVLKNMQYPKIVKWMIKLYT